VLGGRFGPEHVNVATQRRDPGSLLNWFERLIRRRRECPELGFGTLELLDTGAPSVLAHRCDWEGSTIVAVHELAGREAVKRAREYGVAFVSVTNSNHFGVAAYHLASLAAADLVGLALGNSPAAMPAWGGKRPLFGTNPLAAVFPRRDGPALVIDVSLSAVARGKIMVAAREGKPIPEGWAVDAQGHPTTDPRAALQGSMLPAGGVKGAMLALIVELLACALSGAAYGFESDSFFTEEGRPTRIGQALLAVDPGALAGREVYLERIETLITAMTADPEVRLPGERRLRARDKALREGLAVPDELLAKLRDLAEAPSHA